MLLRSNWTPLDRAFALIAGLLLTVPSLNLAFAVWNAPVTSGLGLILAALLGLWFLAWVEFRYLAAHRLNELDYAPQFVLLLLKTPTAQGEWARLKVAALGSFLMCLVLGTALAKAVDVGHLPADNYGYLLFGSLIFSVLVWLFSDWLNTREALKLWR